MRRTIRAIAASTLAVVVLGVSGVGWYAFSTPPEHHLTLSANLIDASSAEGMRLLANSSASVDYAQLLPYFVSQSRRGFCGVATASMLVNAALPHTEPLTQPKLFATDLTGLRDNLAVTFGGMTLDQLAALLHSHGLAVQAVHASTSDVEAFRDVARATLGESRQFLAVNYDRHSLGQEGSGHISPVGAYSPQTDRLPVMDVASYKYPHTWVSVQDLWHAMNTVDPDSEQTRGYVIIKVHEAR
jgi:hypothetical protein